MKIRIQASHFAHVWPVMKELCKQLKLAGVSVSFPDKIPLRELENTVDVHFNLRLEIRKLRKELEDRTL